MLFRTVFGILVGSCRIPMPYKVFWTLKTYTRLHSFVCLLCNKQATTTALVAIVEEVVATMDGTNLTLASLLKR